MEKMILVDYEKCTGCRYCETVCTVQHEGLCNPSLARIKVMKSEMSGFVAPTLCRQCEDAPCVKMCPVRALSRVEDGLGRVSVNYDVCIGCKTCIVACPFGDMKFHATRRRVIKCDLCDGDPVCVKACSTDALRYVDASEADRVKKMEVAEKFSGDASRFGRKE